MKIQAVAEPVERYGGDWTKEKLDILKKYLDAYTTALKNKSFKLMYVDAFAGTGYLELPRPDREDVEVQEFIHGSASIALLTSDKQFDRLIFVERDQARCAELEKLKSGYPNRDIRILNDDANQFLSSLREDWQRWRGVLFLDPFATQVEWSTLRTVAGFEALDTWILFPVSAIARMLPTSRRPDDIENKWAERLTKIYGNETWRALYSESRQLDMFVDVTHERYPGVDELLDIYKKNLKGLFGDRFLDRSRPLKNSRGSVLFELLFCTGSGNPQAIGVAKRIAKHIMEHL